MSLFQNLKQLIFNMIHAKRPRVLFILKKRNNQWGPHDGYSACGGFSSGLYNSANFVNEMLRENNIESNIVEVFDGHCIDKEVHTFQPTHVILEAIVFPPEKFQILTKLHPKIKWIIRNHSEVPFLANEGNGIDWMLKYIKYPNVYISNNSKNINTDFMDLVGYLGCPPDKVVYLPNYYHPKRSYKTCPSARGRVAYCLSRGNPSVEKSSHSSSGRN